MSWIANIARGIAEHGAVVRVTVIRADGSTPRETGAAMLVERRRHRRHHRRRRARARGDRHASARRRLLRRATTLAPDAGWQRDVRNFALGPSLGQCCGGYARLLFELFTARERRTLEALARDPDADAALVLRPLASGHRARSRVEPQGSGASWPLAVTRAVRDMLSGATAARGRADPRRQGRSAWFVEPLARRTVPLYLYGAGHVGRALVRVLRPCRSPSLGSTPRAVALSRSAFPPHVRAQVDARPAGARVGARRPAPTTSS